MVGVKIKNRDFDLYFGFSILLQYYFNEDRLGSQSLRKKEDRLGS